MTFWFDVDDLVRYFCCNSRPTGIQRLSMALFEALQARAPAGNVQFCRRLPEFPYFRRVDFPALDERLCALIIETPPVRRERTVKRTPRQGWRRRLPARQLAALGRIRRALRELAAASRDLATPAPSRGPLGAANLFDLPASVTFAPGDWLINLGSSWNAPYEAAGLAHLRGAGAKFAVLVYDMIPELFPEWTPAPTLAEFRRWLRETLPRADLLFSISENTSADIAHCLAEAGKLIPPIEKLPIGARSGLPGLSPPPPPHPFVLLVSTFEVRKNHALMFRVWQKLLARHGAAQIPDLVFAGKPGWLTGDFLAQLENAGWLDGKIRFVESPSDAELAHLYRQCAFSVYPSFYEGWGLPVSESLGFGKTVAASNRASIPEAGGDFCVYFDPENIQEATRVIEDLIRHPERLAALERHIARNYHPPSWGDAANILLGALARHDEQAGVQPLPVMHQAA
jgi:glycosyltransferase involved in cell wall biosynthesis